MYISVIDELVQYSDGQCCVVFLLYASKHKQMSSETSKGFLDGFSVNWYNIRVTILQ